MLYWTPLVKWVISRSSSSLVTAHCMGNGTKSDLTLTVASGWYYRICIKRPPCNKGPPIFSFLVQDWEVRAHLTCWDMIYYVTVIAKLHQYFFQDSNKSFGNSFTLYWLPYPYLYLTWHYWDPQCTCRLGHLLNSCGLQSSCLNYHSLSHTHLFSIIPHAQCEQSIFGVTININQIRVLDGEWCNQKLTLKGNIILA